MERILMECPICGKTHEVEERKRIAKTIIKNDEVAYEERYYFCDNANDEENEFEFGPMINENLLRARNAYRKDHDLLTSDEIISIRESYGLSQVDLAKLLGWGEATISRYESKAIQDEAYDTMLRLIRDDPLKALDFLEKNAAKFSVSKKKAIKTRILDKLNSYGKEYLSRQALMGVYARYEEPSDFNGFTILNIDKLEAAISYIAENVLNLFKVKLMKLLWYSDALSYKIYGYTITGLVYEHNEMGALPIGHYKIMDLENLNIKEEENYKYDSAMMHIYPTKDMDYDVLTDEDKIILDTVVNKFRDYKTPDFVNYMHEEKAYTATKQGEIIRFSYAREIRDF